MQVCDKISDFSLPVLHSGAVSRGAAFKFFPPWCAEGTQKLLKKKKVLSCRNGGVNQRRGEVPSFVVSIRGSFEGGRNRNLPPSNAVLFATFSWAYKRKWVRAATSD